MICPIILRQQDNAGYIPAMTIAPPHPQITPLPRAASVHTAKVYAQDLAHFRRWCRMQGVDPQPPSPQLLARYITDLAAASPDSASLSPASIRRRLAGIGWACAQRGQALERTDGQINDALAALGSGPKRALRQRQGIRQDQLHAMIATLPHDLRGMRDRAILLIGIAGALRRSEITGLTLDYPDATQNSGWIERTDSGLTLHLRRKNAMRQVQIARAPYGLPCPIHALDQWLHYARIKSGPVFVAVSRDGRRALSTPLNDKHIPRLIHKAALAIGGTHQTHGTLSLRAAPSGPDDP